MKLTHVLGSTWVIEAYSMIGLYQLDDSRCILLDSGDTAEREELSALLAEAGLTPVGVISTHTHMDHIINNGWLRRTYGTQAAMPVGEAPLCHDLISQKVALYSLSVNAIDRFYGQVVSEVDVTIPYEDGPFSFFGAQFQIVHTPGHSSDHISVITPDGVCYVGDGLVSNDYLSSKLPHHLYIERSLESFRKLGQLNCPGYIIAHRGIHSRLEEIIAANEELLRQRIETIRSLLTHPMTFAEWWYAVVEHFQLFTSRPARAGLFERNFRYFVDYIVDHKMATLSCQRGIIRYSPVEQETST